MMEDIITEFFRAIEKGNVDSVVQLIRDEKNYNVVNAENEEGKNAFQVALEYKHFGKWLFLRFSKVMSWS